MWKQQIESYVSWLKKAGKAEATVIAYQKDIEQLAEFLMKGGKTDFQQVTAEDIEAYKAELNTLRYTDKSVSRKLNSIKSFFRYLLETDVVAENPVRKVSHPKYKVAPPRVLAKTEYRALRDACKTDARMSAVIELLLQTGIRISELAGMQLEDINLDKQELFIRAHGSHGSRIVPLNEAACDAIRLYEKIRPRTKERTFFLTKSCRPFLVRNIRSAIDRYFKIAGIEDAKVNDLRHTFIVEQLAAGVPLVNVSKIVGHKRLSTTERYLQFLDLEDMHTDVEIREL
ncbi:tyrosine-type recombinase/integrase [Candidatus Woesebacteria bacterium]|nr:tyrosine-type recombinase/integrase [Candidatus Woesebacteria bacterium]MCD8507410.1 tyrosine-type recombinase/integrase [Candidatus Woesebacteria bacterium]MCD8527349.1 tyrosine-type recombinase/integrase [Candidatus Woesebacteria bacterium]MCD8546096.1 tyrosine-type recombinase/integrase [Candidatus Woesebacteria bacterium]